MQGEPQQKPLTITLNEGDWSVILSALYEAPVPMKIMAPVANRLQSALAEAQKPNEVVPLKGKA